MKIKPLVITIVMFSFVAVPASAQEQSSVQSQEAFLMLIASLTEQVVVLQAQLEAQLAVESKVEVAPEPLSLLIEEEEESEWSYNRTTESIFEGSEIREELLTDDYDVKTYLVRNDRLYEDYQRTKNTQTDSYRIWNIYADILGDDWVEKNIRQYNTYRDPEGSLLGFVWKMRDESPSWGLAVDISRSDFSNIKWVRDMSIVLIHEASHIITLDEDQILKSIKYEKYCTKKKGWFSGRECADEDSYLYAFGNKFWSYSSVVSYFNAKNGLEGEERYSAIKDYYKEHSDDFVTEYAATSPTEDISESFTNFILEEKPEGETISDQKINFFYNYPELVERRIDIREEIKEYFVQ